MSVVPVDEPPGVTGTEAERKGFWHRLARALDQHFVDRSRRAVPATALRRSKRDIERCHQLMHKNAYTNALAPADAGFGARSHHRAVRVPQ